VLQFYSSTTELAVPAAAGEIVRRRGLDLFAYGAVAGGSPIGWAPLDTGKFLSYNEAEIVAGSPEPEGRRDLRQLPALRRGTRARPPRPSTTSREPGRDRAADRRPGVRRGAKDPGAAGFVPVDLDFVAQQPRGVDRRVRPPGLGLMADPNRPDPEPLESLGAPGAAAPIPVVIDLRSGRGRRGGACCWRCGPPSCGCSR